jgi:hypothetical protein
MQGLDCYSLLESHFLNLAAIERDCISIRVPVYPRALLCSNGHAEGGGGKLFEDSVNLCALIQIQRYNILQIVLLHRVNLHLHR